MKCITPVSIKNPNKRKAATDKYIDVPCGRCGNCISNQANAWTFRLSVEERSASSAHFVTLTMSDKYLTNKYKNSDYPSLEKREVQLFIKKLRKYQDKVHKGVEKIKYYIVGEYGDKTGRPHYHAILFNVQYDIMLQIDKIWSHGNVHIGNVTRQSINYVTYYIFKKKTNTKKNEKYNRENEFALMSKNLGIDYVKNKKYHRENMTYVAIINGRMTALPKYYKDKFFNAGEQIAMTIKYKNMSDKDYEEEIQKLKKYGIKNPEAHIFINKFRAQEMRLDKLKSDKL